MRSNGDTNPLSVLIVVALVAGAFYAWHVAPLYYDNLEVREACTQAYNIYVTEGPNNAKGALVRRLNMSDLGWHYEINDDGEEVILPGLNIPEEDMLFEEVGNNDLRVSVKYTRTIQFKPLEKRKTYTFQAEKRGKLQKK